MKVTPNVPAGLCVAAGLLLAADAVVSYLTGNSGSLGSASEFDLFSFAVGMYFIGKGFFIQLLLQGQHKL